MARSAWWIEGELAFHIGAGVAAKACAAAWRALFWHEGSSTQHHRTPVPLHRWHFTTLSPFLSKPLPSQFLHFCFFLMFGPFSLVIGCPCRWSEVDWRFVGAALVTVHLTIGCSFGPIRAQLAGFWNLLHESANGFETRFLLLLPSRLDVELCEVGF